MAWTLLDDSPDKLAAVYKKAQASERTLSLTLEQTNYHYPKAKTVFRSMQAIKQWFKKANVKLYYRGLEHLTKVPGRRNIMIPNHPNLFDSLVLRLLCYLAGEPVQYTAAVMALEKVPLVAKLLRENGAFFIDTKRFHELPYREKVNSFMRQVVDAGEWLQVYFEGDRHSSERQRLPRHGLLKALVDQPCAFFPISISYEQIVTAYFNNVGAIYVDVHEPILFDPDDDFERLAIDLSSTVQRGVNCYTTDLVATLLLDKGSLKVSDLEGKVEWLRAILVSRELEYIDVSLTDVTRYLNLKLKEGVLHAPADTKRLNFHRERIMHALYDLAEPPEFIRYEFAWTPPPPLLDDDELRGLAQRALTPLITMYSRLIALLEQGVYNVTELEKQLVNGAVTGQVLRNSLRILQSRSVINLVNGVITLN